MRFGLVNPFQKGKYLNVACIFSKGPRGYCNMKQYYFTTSFLKKKIKKKMSLWFKPVADISLLRNTVKPSMIFARLLII